jgi:hypothetical protein
MLEESPPDRDPAYRCIGTWPSVEGIDSWATGDRFRVSVPEPLEFALDRTNPGKMFAFSKVQIPVMRDDLLAAIREAGVSNLDAYRAVIRDPLDGTVHQGYFAVNIVGAVAAVDWEKSEFDPEIPERLVSADFDRVVIDESKTGGALMFRLAECVSGIVIHEKVRDRLIARGFGFLGFIDPKDWVG